MTSYFKYNYYCTKTKLSLLKTGWKCFCETFMSFCGAVTLSPLSSSILPGDGLLAKSDWSRMWSRRQDIDEWAADITSEGEVPERESEAWIRTLNQNKPELSNSHKLCVNVCLKLPECVSAPCRSVMEDRMLEERRLEWSQRVHTAPGSLLPSSPLSETQISH